MSTVSRLANMSIRSKIICAFSALMVIIVALGITAVQRLSVLNGTVETITSDTLVGTGYLSEMRGAILHYRLALTKAILGKADVKGDALDRTLAEWSTAVAAQEAKYAPTVETAEEKALFAGYQASWKAYLEGAQQMLSLWHDGKYDEAIDRLGRAASQGEQVDAALDKDVKYNTEVAKQLTDQAASDYGGGRLIILILLGVSIVVSVAAGYVMVRAIARPIQAMTAAMRGLAAKDMTVEIPAKGRTDEVGQMAEAVSVFKENMIRADELAVAAGEASGGFGQRFRGKDRWAGRRAVLGLDRNGGDGTVDVFDRHPDQPAGFQRRIGGGGGKRGRADCGFGRRTADKLHQRDQPAGGAVVEDHRQGGGRRQAHRCHRACAR
jgi:methyl-accepting chemotaxis protein